LVYVVSSFVVNLSL